MGIDYTLVNLDKREFLCPKYLPQGYHALAHINPKCPLESPLFGELVHVIMRQVWGGDRIKLWSDAIEEPWLYGDEVAHWSNAYEKHLVEFQSVEQEQGILVPPDWKSPHMLPGPERPPQGIAAAAIAVGSTVTALPRPARHTDVLVQLAPQGYHALAHVYGFVTWDRCFVGRAQAKWIARDAGQLEGPLKGGVLTSEDLW